MMTFLTAVAVWVALAFASVGWFAYSQYKCCRAFNERPLPPELRNYD